MSSPEQAIKLDDGAVALKSRSELNRHVTFFRLPLEIMDVIIKDQHYDVLYSLKLTCKGLDTYIGRISDQKRAFVLSEEKRRFVERRKQLAIELAIEQPFVRPPLRSVMEAGYQINQQTGQLKPPTTKREYIACIRCWRLLPVPKCWPDQIKWKTCLDCLATKMNITRVRVCGLVCTYCPELGCKRFAYDVEDDPALREDRQGTYVYLKWGVQYFPRRHRVDERIWHSEKCPRRVESLCGTCKEHLKWDKCPRMQSSCRLRCMCHTHTQAGTVVYKGSSAIVEELS